jgi:hypothetical protein
MAVNGKSNTVLQLIWVYSNIVQWRCWPRTNWELTKCYIKLSGLSAVWSLLGKTRCLSADIQNYMIYMIYDTWYDIWYGMIWYMIWYLLTAIGLSPGGSTHLHKNNTQNNTNNNRTTQITISVEECGPCPVFSSFTLAFALQLRKSTEKPQSG